MFIVTADGPEPQDELERRCQQLPGVSVVQPAIRCERDAAAARADARSTLLRGRSGAQFAMRSRRRDKTFPLRSIELDWIVGDAVRRAARPARRPRSGPDLELLRRGRPQGAARLGRPPAGAGGLPVGSSGRALVLLSGGLDSPVAA